MIMMMTINCFCGMVDRRNTFSLISRRIFDTPRTGFEPAENLSSGLVEWSCALVITTAAPHMRPRIINYRSFKDFSNDDFRKTLIDRLHNQTYVNNDDGFVRLCKVSIDALYSCQASRIPRETQAFLAYLTPASRLVFFLTLQKNLTQNSRLTFHKWKKWENWFLLIPPASLLLPVTC